MGTFILYILLVLTGLYALVSSVVFSWALYEYVIYSRSGSVNDFLSAFKTENKAGLELPSYMEEKQLLMLREEIDRYLARIDD